MGAARRLDTPIPGNPFLPPATGRRPRQRELSRLEEAIRRAPSVPQGAEVLLDDVWLLEREPPASHRLRDPDVLARLDEGEVLERYDLFGAGSLATAFLLSSGFRLAAFDEHAKQVLLIADRQRPVGPYPDGYFATLLHEHRLVSYPSTSIGQALARARRHGRRVVARARAAARLRARGRAALRRN